MSGPLTLIKTIVRREMTNVHGETNFNNKRMWFGSPEQIQDISYIVESNYVTDDSSDEWFRIGISKWGESGHLVGD